MFVMNFLYNFRVYESLTLARLVDSANGELSFDRILLAHTNVLVYATMIAVSHSLTNQL